MYLYILYYWADTLINLDNDIYEIDYFIYIYSSTSLKFIFYL